MAIGYLAKAYCNEELEIQVLKSASGFYIGTCCEHGYPCSRESEQYWPTKALAETALETGDWDQRPRP